MSYSVHHLDVVGSTNAFAKDNIDAINHKTLVLAKRQTAGRGRGSNTWLTKEGNFTGSIVLKPETPFSFEQAGQLSFVTACAIFNSLKYVFDHHDVNELIGLKWPNDVYVQGKKISGILIEIAKSDNKYIYSLVIGAGINLKNKPPIDTAICLQDVLNEVPALNDFADIMTHQFDLLLTDFIKNGFDPIRDLFLRHAINVGKEINVRLTNREFRAIYQTIDHKGQLVVQHADGKIEHIASADIFF